MTTFTICVENRICSIKPLELHFTFKLKCKVLQEYIALFNFAL